MFKMIGGDGREYGPISAEQLRQWIGEQRANGQTMLQREGTTDWLPLSAFPEFAEALAAAWHGELTPPAAPPPPLAGSREFPALDRDGFPTGSLDIAGCLGRGWMLLGRHPFLLIGACGLVWLITTGIAFVPCAGPLISLAISGALYGGLAVMFLRLIRGQETHLGEVFGGFGPAFAALLLVWVISGLVSGLGLLFCLIPGLILKALWVFALPLAADRGLPFWTAMEASRRAVLRQFMAVASLLVVAWLPVIVFEGYAIWRTSTYMMDVLGPITMWNLETLRTEMEQIVAFSLRIELQRTVVLLLNLPFAMSAVMHGYESLFGNRHDEASG